MTYTPPSREAWREAQGRIKRVEEARKEVYARVPLPPQPDPDSPNFEIEYLDRQVAFHERQIALWEAIGGEPAEHDTQYLAELREAREELTA